METLTKPLADLIRPTTFSTFVGQEHLVGKDGPIRKAVEKHNIYSMIFWGPPGCGKTTLARIIAKELNFRFVEISPVSSGVKDIKEIVARAKEELEKSKVKTLLFVDEIHRFNKSQQDYLLPHVETGILTLIGATTENPSFEIVSPLLSRCHVYVLKPLSVGDLQILIKEAVIYISKLGIDLNLKKDAFDFLVQIAYGDARSAINTIEALFITSKGKKITVSRQDIENVLQKKTLLYDKLGEEHYNTISAFIKSMRASNVDGALYYLAKMVEAGEDPLFIARRMVIFASEDIGIAQPTALVVANAVFRACETIGYPECQINLAHGVVYLAQAKKNREAYSAYFKALDDVRSYGSLPVPLKLRNAPTKLMKDLGYGAGYEAYSTEDYLPKEIAGRKYFNVDKSPH